MTTQPKGKKQVILRNTEVNDNNERKGYGVKMSVSEFKKKVISGYIGTNFKTVREFIEMYQRLLNNDILMLNIRENDIDDITDITGIETSEVTFTSHDPIKSLKKRDDFEERINRIDEQELVSKVLKQVGKLKNSQYSNFRRIDYKDIAGKWNSLNNNKSSLYLINNNPDGDNYTLGNDDNKIQIYLDKCADIQKFYILKHAEYLKLFYLVKELVELNRKLTLSILSLTNLKEYDSTGKEITSEQVKIKTLIEDINRLQNQQDKIFSTLETQSGGAEEESTFWKSTDLTEIEPNYYFKKNHMVELTDEDKLQPILNKCYNLEVLYRVKHFEVIEMMKPVLYLMDTLTKNYGLLLYILTLYTDRPDFTIQLPSIFKVNYSKFIKDLGKLVKGQNEIGKLVENTFKQSGGVRDADGDGAGADAPAATGTDGDAIEQKINEIIQKLEKEGKFGKLYEDYEGQNDFIKTLIRIKIEQMLSNHRLKNKTNKQQLILDKLLNNEDSLDKLIGGVEELIVDSPISNDAERSIRSSKSEVNSFKKYLEKVKSGFNERRINNNISTLRGSVSANILQGGAKKLTKRNRRKNNKKGKVSKRNKKVQRGGKLDSRDVPDERRQELISNAEARGTAGYADLSNVVSNNLSKIGMVNQNNLNKTHEEEEETDQKTSPGTEPEPEPAGAAEPEPETQPDATPSPAYPELEPKPEPEEPAPAEAEGENNIENENDGYIEVTAGVAKAEATPSPKGNNNGGDDYMEVVGLGEEAGAAGAEGVQPSSSYTSVNNSSRINLKKLKTNLGYEGDNSSFAGGYRKNGRSLRKRGPKKKTKKTKKNRSKRNTKSLRNKGSKK